MYRSSSFVLYDDQQRFLIQLRDEHAPRAPNKWALFGGTIEHGETPEQAVMREAQEELGYVMRKPRFVLKKTYDELGGIEQHVFVDRYDGSAELTLHEGKSLGWFRVDELDTIPILEHAKDVVEILHSKLFLNQNNAL